MSDRPAYVLHRLSGSPEQSGAAGLATPERCRVCGALTSRGAPYDRWQGSNFTDQNKLRFIAGTVVCEPCIWAHAWNPPPDQPPPAPGKKGLNLRLFSHLFDDDGYRSLNKADKPAIRDWLCAPKSPPWWCAIADTGQKHVVPWTPVNLHPRLGVIRFEESDVTIDCDALRSHIDTVIALLTAGATKAEIEAGRYRPTTWQRCAAIIRGHEERYAAERGGDLARLVVWLAQRDEDAVAERMEKEKEAKHGRGKKRQGDRSDGGPDPRPTRRVSRERGQRAEALGPARGEGDARGADEFTDERVVLDAPAAAEPGQPEQLGLFSDGGPLR